MKYFIGLIITFIVGCSIGYVGNEYLKPKQSSKILKTISIDDNKGLYEAYQTPITITATKDKIIASDSYKQSVISMDTRTNFVFTGVGYVHNNSGSILYSVGYFNSIKHSHLEIGGVFSVSSSSVGITAVVGYSF